MKLLTVILILVIGSVYKASAQKLTFAYDSAGNQVERLWIDTMPIAPLAVPIGEQSLNSQTDTILLRKRTNVSNNGDKRRNATSRQKKQANVVMTNPIVRNTSLEPTKKRSHLK